MNNYLFRGKPTPEALENPDIQEYIKDGWVYGNLIWNNGDPWIVGDIVDWSDEYISLEWWVPVVPETVSLRHQLHKKDIYVGDVLKITMENENIALYEVTKTGVGLINIKKLGGGVSFPLEWLIGYYFEIIGNIHDNPELLKEHP